MKNRILWVAVSLLILSAGSTVSGNQPPRPEFGALSVRWDAVSGKALVVNGRLELVIETKSGLNPRSLLDSKTGWVLADRDYSWPGGRAPRIEGEPAIVELADGGRSVSFKAQLGTLSIEQVFFAPAAEPDVIYERITILNPGRAAISSADFRCGFSKLVREGEAWAADAGDLFCPIPYRRETDGKMQEFPLRDIAVHGMTYAGWAEKPIPTPIWGAEGWAWTRGPASFLLAKYNQAGMEWSLMEPEMRGNDTVIRFGGAGLWKHGLPEAAAKLEPGGSYTFGETRFQAVDGDWKKAYYAYRDFTGRRGCRPPAGYDPPVHWNELYDNKYFPKSERAMEENLKPDKSGLEPGFFEANRKLLGEFYTLDEMLGEAAKAKDLGCEALYLDPGWDTGWNQQIWDAARLGPMDSFVGRMKRDFGLKISLWNALGNVPPSYGDPESCPPEAGVVDRDGRRTGIICIASPAFLKTKESRLIDLCRQGATFLMLDATQYSGPCYDASHGHSIPSTREEQVAALFELIRRIKIAYPQVLIELHDPVSGPCSIHYTPTYFGFGRPNSFDCLWGHEFMWRSLDDVLTKKAVSLYYYNLAYSIPLYLHVSLKNDNESSLVFWWFASTCRHLGVGGKPGPAVWEAEKRAMRTYRSLKEFYVRGIFYGIEETVLAHTLPGRREAVINVFNLDDTPAVKSVRFRPGDIGLPDGDVVVEGAPFVKSGGDWTADVEIPARGHLLLKVRSRRSGEARQSRP